METRGAAGLGRAIRARPSRSTSSPSPNETASTAMPSTSEKQVKLMPAANQKLSFCTGKYAVRAFSSSIGSGTEA